MDETNISMPDLLRLTQKLRKQVKTLEGKIVELNQVIQSWYLFIFKKYSQV